jgi:hypothetical protein
VEEDPEGEAPKENAAEPEKKPDEPLTAEQYVAAAPKDIQDVLADSLETHNREKAELIQGLKANKNCSFTEEQLKAKAIGELRALNELARGAKVSYAGRQVPTSNDGTPQEEEPLEVPSVNDFLDKGKDK